MDVRQGYNKWAATYDTDRNRTRDLDGQVTRETLKGARFTAILELGCGTGKNTAFLSQIATRVHALDFAGGMIERAKEKIGTANVRFTVCDLTQPWPCTAQSADLVVCNLVLEHIADLGFVFQEAWRCLMESGQFLVCELHPFKQYLGTKARFQQENRRVELPTFVHHLSDFLNAAVAAGFTLSSLKESWHSEDEDQPPRLISFLFHKGNP